MFGLVWFVFGVVGFILLVAVVVVIVVVVVGCCLLMFVVVVGVVVVVDVVVVVVVVRGCVLRHVLLFEFWVCVMSLVAVCWLLSGVAIGCCLS